MKSERLAVLCSLLGNMGGDAAKGIHHQTDREMATTARAEVSDLRSEGTARAEGEKGGEKGVWKANTAMPLGTLTSLREEP